MGRRQTGLQPQQHIDHNVAVARVSWASHNLPHQLWSSCLSILPRPRASCVCQSWTRIGNRGCAFRGPQFHHQLHHRARDLHQHFKSDENWQRVLQPAMTGNVCCDQRGIANGCCALLRVHHRFRGQCRHLVHCRGRFSGRRSLEVVANVVLHTSVDVRSSEPPGLRSWLCGFSGVSDLLEALGIDVHCR